LATVKLATLFGPFFAICTAISLPSPLLPPVVMQQLFLAKNAIFQSSHHIHSVAHQINLITHADMWIWLPACIVCHKIFPPTSPPNVVSLHKIFWHTWYMQELTLTSKVPCILRILCMVLESNVLGVHRNGKAEFPLTLASI